MTRILIKIQRALVKYPAFKTSMYYNDLGKKWSIFKNKYTNLFMVMLYISKVNKSKNIPNSKELLKRKHIHVI